MWGDWEEPYLTLDPAYEAAQLEVFGTMFLNGHIYRGRKPVHWSPSSQTALAESVRFNAYVLWEKHAQRRVVSSLWISY